jgi:hypothetical protein
MAFLVLNKPKDIQINNYVGRNGKDGVSIQGIQGERGLSGVQGIQGIPGQSIKGDKGEPGKDGKTEIITIYQPIETQLIPGPRGVSQTFKVDPESCILMSKYENDRFWKEIAQLPKPCEVKDVE